MQLEMFQTFPESQEHPPIWKDLNQDQQKGIISILARLMAKKVIKETEGKQDE